MKIKDVFIVKSGLRIVAKDAYRYKGKLPFVAAQTTNDGIIRYSDENWLGSLRKNGQSVIVSEPCITWTKNGYAGKLFYRDYPFYPGDDCGILIPRAEYKEKVNLKWFVYAKQEYIRTFATSKGTQGKLFDTQMSEIEIDLPDITIQNQMVTYYDSLNAIKIKAELILNKINLLLNKHITYNNELTEYVVKKVFRIEGGNSGLTEEVIYLNKPSTPQNTIKVYSSSTLCDTSLGVVDMNTKINEKPIKVFNAPAIIIARNGQAGSVQYINEGTFTTNDHAYVLTLKDENNNCINLKWFAYICEQYTKKCVSSKDSNGTFCKDLFVLTTIFVPTKEEQLELVDVYEKLLEANEKANKVINITTRIIK